MKHTALVLAQSDPARDTLQGWAEELGESWDSLAPNLDAQEAEMGGAWPSLVLLDLAVEEPVARVRAAVRRFKGVTIVACGDARDEGEVLGVLRAGALSYVARHYTPSQAGLVLQLSVQGVGHRTTPLRPDVTATDPANGDVPEEHALNPSANPYEVLSLTPKQLEVFSNLAEGLSNKRIAARMGITVGTVKLHLSEIYERLKVEGRGEAIHLASTLKRVHAHQILKGEAGTGALDWLLPHVKGRHCTKGEVLFHRGDSGTELYYLQRGMVVLEEIGVEMGKGEIFGEIALFAPDRARTCTARCATDVELFCMTSEQVKMLYYINPLFALHIVTLLARRLTADRERAG